MQNTSKNYIIHLRNYSWSQIKLKSKILFADITSMLALVNVQVFVHVYAFLLVVYKRKSKRKRYFITRHRICHQIVGVKFRINSSAIFMIIWRFKYNKRQYPLRMIKLMHIHSLYTWKWLRVCREYKWNCHTWTH